MSVLKSRINALIAWGESYAKTDLRYLFRSGSWLTFGQIFITSIAFVLSIAFARYLPKEVYGNYRYLLSVFWTLTAFSLTGISTALTRAIARGEDAAFGVALRLSIFGSLPMTVISLGLALYYFLHANILLAEGTFLIALIGPFMQGAYLYGSFLEGKKLFKQNALAGIGLNFFPAIALLGTLLVSRSAMVLFSVYLVANVLTGFVISILMYRRYRENANKPAPGFGWLGAHLSFMNVLSTVANQIDRLLVYHFLGAVDLAVYAFATAMPDQLKSIFNSVSTFAFPKFVTRPIGETRTTLPRKLVGLTLVAGLCIVIYILLAPYAFQLFFPGYTAAIGYSDLYALALIFIGGTIPPTILQAHMAKRALYIFNTGDSLFQIGSLVLLIPLYGLLGAVIARVIARAFSFMLGMFLLRPYAVKTE